MNSKIQVLASDVADKIAAGEVAERPSSVVKELVENAIDAGADRITVEIKNGGVRLIRVADNGKGIPSDQVEIAFLRHATSKLVDADDLFKISTMGFRGEALASICAVAKVEVITKTIDTETGVHYIVDHGECGEKDEIACADGTIMVIEDLFANVPARMKFLKKDSTEAGYISDLMTRLALSKPSIAFDYICDGKQVFNTSGDGDIKNVILKVYGLKFAKGVISVDYKEDGVGIQGVIGKPEISFGNRTKQTLFVNGRYVKNHVVAKIVEEAFRNSIMVGKFPFFVLNIDLPSEMVDVNVHPAKTEVKFANEKQLYDIVYHAVKNSLYSGSGRTVSDTILEPVNSKPTEQNNGYHGKTFGYSGSGKTLGVVNASDRSAGINKEVTRKYLEYTKPNVIVEAKQSEALNNKSADTEDKSGKIDLDEVLSNTLSIDNTTKNIDKDTSSYSVDNKKSEDNSKFNNNDNQLSQSTFTNNDCDKTEEAQALFFDDYRIVGQLFDTYVIVNQGELVYLIDQHAAHERVRFEKLKKSYFAGERMSQLLLSPIVVDLSHLEFDTVMSNLKEYERLGFAVEEFGTNTVIINETPLHGTDSEITDLFLEITEALINNIKHPIADFEEKALDMISCKYAIKAHDKLSLPEMTEVVNHVNELYKLGIKTCPHGRPIMIESSKKEIEKMFKRIV